jgi:hypothetical protein
MFGFNCRKPSMRRATKQRRRKAVAEIAQWRAFRCFAAPRALPGRAQRAYNFSVGFGRINSIPA